MLGIRPGFDELIIDPCIPADWKEYEVSRRWRGATYKITVHNPDGVMKGVKSITLGGKPVAGAIPPQKAGSVHDVVVIMGQK
jgi:N,N'-diacetylchitobiose phosphorylase